MRRLALLLALPACSYFPSHEEVFIPVPLGVGEARVVDGDTSWVLAGAVYEIVAPRQELLPDARRSLDEATEQFQAIFGVAPPRVTVALHDPAGRDDESKGTAVTAGESGGEVVDVRVPPEIRDRGRTMARPRHLPLAPVARVWLSAYVDQRAATPRLRTGYVPFGAPVEDPRLPDWLEDGIVQIVAGSPLRDLALARLADERSRAIPLRDLLKMRRPAVLDDASRGEDALVRGDDERRALFGGELEGARLFAVQSYGVARFLAEREGRPVLGAMVDRVIAGETALAVLDGAKHLPGDIDALQREWERWLEEEHENGPRR